MSTRKIVRKMLDDIAYKRWEKIFNEIENIQHTMSSIEKELIPLRKKYNIALNKMIRFWNKN